MKSLLVIEEDILRSVIYVSSSMKTPIFLVILGRSQVPQEIATCPRCGTRPVG